MRNLSNAPTADPPPFFSTLSIYSFLFADGTDGTCPDTIVCRNLTAWAEGGVLMLNTCLTVRAHTAGSHQGKGWEQFTDRVIDVVDRHGGANLGDKSGFGRGVVFLAWGAWAAKRVAKLNKVSVQRLPDNGGSRPSWTPSTHPLLFFSSFPLSFFLFHWMLTTSSLPLCIRLVPCAC